MIGARNIIDVADVEGLDHGRWAHVAEQGDLAPLIHGNFAVSTAKEDVGLDTD